MNHEKHLPVAESPIRCLQYLSYPLNILANDNDYLPWFYSNYIQLAWNRDLSSLLTFYYFGDVPDWRNILWIDYQSFHKNIFALNNIDISSFIVNSINEGWYFYTSYDEFYIPDTLVYNTQHFIHDFLIYGYNLEDQTYSILGYTRDMVMRKRKIGFGDFRKAFLAGINDYRVILMKKRKNFYYNFDIRNVYAMLSEYLYAKDTSMNYSAYRNPDPDKVYGMEIYKYLKMYFEKPDSFDMRPLHLFYEHKKCMTQRIKYMNANGFLIHCEYLNDIFIKIEAKCLILRNIQLKYIVTKNKRNIEKILHELHEIETAERNGIEIALEEIKQKEHF